MVWQGISSVGCCVCVTGTEKLVGTKVCKVKPLVKKLLGTKVAGSTLDSPRSD